MILYRVMSSEELKELMGIEASKCERSTYCGNNTFIYERNTEYMHFFKYAEHAKDYLYKFGVIIAKFNIPDEIIDQKGFGFYNSDIPVLPEYIIKKENFDINYIVDFKSSLTFGWCKPKVEKEKMYGQYLGSCGELYEALIHDLRQKFREERCSDSFNNYVVSKLKDKEIDELLPNYIQKVNEKHFPPKKSIFKRK